MASDDVSIEIVHDSDFSTYKIGTNTDIFVNLVKVNGNKIDITNNVNTKIFALDDSIFFDDVTKNLLFKEEGSGILKAVYTNSFGEVFTAQVKFIAYDTFYRDNYIDHLVSTFEKGKLQKNVRLKVFMDTLMEIVDIFYAYNKDIQVISCFSDVKSEFLDILGQSVGFERIDYESVNTADEPTANKVYRELLANVFDLLNIRGTYLSYQLFFNALGYDIELQEFWYNENSELIEVNPYDDAASTYYRYDTNGILLDSPPIPNPDPRQYANTNNVFINNKSNYIRPILTSINTQIAPSPGSFTSRKRQIIRQYLEYLRPVHIQYIQELVNASVNVESVDFIDEAMEFFATYDFFEVIVATEILWSMSESFNASPGRPFNETLAFNKKWDTGIKWDDDHIWDDSNLFLETFAVANA